VNTQGWNLVASVADLGLEAAARERADLLEYRMDLASGDPLSALQSYDGTLPILATNRVRSEGGEAPDGETRLQLLAEAATLDPVVAVDVELGHLTDGRAGIVRERAPSETTIVASAHDFDGTPPMPDCRTRLRRACDAGDIGKVVVTAPDRSAALRVLRLADWANREGLAFATHAMGESGRFSRALCPLFGSSLAYAPLEGETSTAPGQYDLHTLATLLDRL
jgi:3-dehydroquinate dehydratase-1